MRKNLKLKKIKILRKEKLLSSYQVMQAYNYLKAWDFINSSERKQIKEDSLEEEVKGKDQ